MFYHRTAGLAQGLENRRSSRRKRSSLFPLFVSRKVPSKFLRSATRRKRNISLCSKQIIFDLTQDSVGSNSDRRRRSRKKFWRIRLHPRTKEETTSTGAPPITRAEQSLLRQLNSLNMCQSENNTFISIIFYPIKGTYLIFFETE